MKVMHVFNTHILGGPEKATLPGLELLKTIEIQCSATFLVERRLSTDKGAIAEYAENCSVGMDIIDVKSRFDRQAIAELKSLVMSKNIRFLHAHGYKATVYAILASKGTAAGIVSTFHGFINTGLKNRFYNLLHVLYSRQLSGLVALSESQARNIRSQLWYSASRVPLFVIETPIAAPGDVEKQRAENIFQDLIRERTGDPDKLPPRPWIGQVARLSKEKNHGAVIRGLAGLNIQLPWTLWLLGSGPEEKKLKSLVNHFGLQDKVMFCGHVTDADQLLTGFDAILAPSKQEVLPMVILEAGIRGVPIISVKLPEILDILPDDKHVILIDECSSAALEEAMYKLLNQPEQVQEIVQKAKIRIENKYSMENWKRKITAMYSELD